MVRSKSQMVLVQLMLLLLGITDGSGEFNEDAEKQKSIGVDLMKHLNSTCKDKSPMCYAVHASYCNEAPLKTYCKATCGYCPKGVPKKMSIRPSPGKCEDLDPKCPTLKEYCAGTIWVQNQCQKTCGLCYEEETDEDLHEPSSCVCGIVNDPSILTTNSTNQYRVVGGKEALKNKYPWMVNILMKYRSFIAQCGGSIINTRYVLTAGHCTYIAMCEIPYEASAMTVTVADHNIYSMNDDIKGVTEKFLVKKIIRHEDLCLEPKMPNHFNNDIALLKLEKDLDLSHMELGIPCLPQKASSTYEVKTVIVAGWGFDDPADSDNRSMPSKLQEAEFKVMRDCRKYRFQWHITHNMICAGDLENMKDACGGDSGGPLMYKEKNNRYTQIGLVSFGPPGGNCTGIGIYTNLAVYVNWIKTHTRDGQCPTGIAN